MSDDIEKQEGEKQPEKRKPNLRLPLGRYEENEKSSVDLKRHLRAPGGNYDLASEEKRLVEEISKSHQQKPTTDQVHHWSVLKSMKNNAFWQAPEKDDYSDLIPQNICDLDQVTETDDGDIRIFKQEATLDEEGIVRGSAFLRALRTAANTGGHARIPLWSSGFWVTVGDFNTTEIFRTASRLKEIRDNIGLSTNGLLYSIEDVHINTAIIDFLLDHVIDSNLKDWTNKNILRQALLITDSQHLMAGGLDAMYQNGYPLHQECRNALKTSGKDKCTYSTHSPEEKLKNVSRLHFNRTALKIGSRFPAKAHRFMTKEEVTLEEVREYQQEIMDHNNISHVIGNYEPSGVRIRLYGTTPNYSRYRTEGSRWVADVISIAEDLVIEGRTEQQDYEQRQRMIANRSQQVMAQHQHSWIEKIQVNKAINDSREDILEGLAILSENRELCKQVREDIRAYSKRQMHCFTAISDWVCPECKSTQPGVDEEINLIPLNMTAYFFTILVDRALQSSS